MLSQLYIENYALIDSTDVKFNPGLTVITGETGAGKSIMLHALGLVMGDRADTKVMGDKSRKTIVEATFQNPPEYLNELLEDEGLDSGNCELILRREINPSGKSRGFINDTPVTLSVLSKISDKLIDIHSQNGNTALRNSEEQLELLDSYAGDRELLETFKNVFNEYVELRSKIKKTKEQQALSRENREYLLFRLEQLDKLKLKEDELPSLEKEFDLLSDADRIKSDLSEAYNFLDGNSQGAIKSINLATSSIDSIDFSLLDRNENDNENILQRLESVKIELRDIADTISNYMERISSDPEKCEKIKERIDLIYDTLKRFKVKDDTELLTLHERLKEELTGIENEETELPEWGKKLKSIGKTLKEKAEKLSEARAKAAEDFSKELIDRIKPLGMPNVNFEVEITKGKITHSGQDNVVFSCSFNKNHKKQPISEIASGGEISRVMLGIKSIMAEKMQLPTMIFDEIDSGVSGEIAHKMGRMMKEISSKIQVITVTHLPQVAASGLSHFKVYKTDSSEKTISMIKVLNNEERIIEIAGMMSGNEINESAITAARVLLES